MKKLFLILCAFTVCCSAAVVAYQNYKQQNMSEFALKNLIALTDTEGGESGLTPGESTSYHYPYRQGTPVRCTVYRYYKLDTGAKVYEGPTPHPTLEAHLGFEFGREDISGLEDDCGKDGSGCNPYTCQSIAYVP